MLNAVTVMCRTFDMQGSRHSEQVGSWGKVLGGAEALPSLRRPGVQGGFYTVDTSRRGEVSSLRLGSLKIDTQPQ